MIGQLGLGYVNMNPELGFVIFPLDRPLNTCDNAYPISGIWYQESGIWDRL
jgi:hypothetical protein